MWIYYVDTRRRSKLKRGVSTSRYLVARCAAQSSDTQKICQILYVHHCQTAKRTWLLLFLLKKKNQ